MIPTLERELQGLLEAMEVHKLQRGVILTENVEEILNLQINGLAATALILPVWKWSIQ